MILLCGATGDLGGRIARCLHERRVPFRALVRPGGDTGAVRALAAEVEPGDFRDPASLRRAVAGTRTVISTVTAIGRMLGGERGTGFDRVDVAGHLDLVAAAEEAGVERFVFVSAAGMRAEPAASTPIGAAKNATEDRLGASPLREVVVRPDMFQEVWLSPLTQFDWPARKVVIHGRGETPARYVSTDDAAEAVVRLALAADPPRLVEFGGPQALTRKEAVDVFEQALGERIVRRHVPRVALRLGARGLRPVRPALACVMGLALGADLHAAAWDDRPLRSLGIEPRSVAAYAAAVTRATAAAAEGR